MRRRRLHGRRRAPRQSPRVPRRRTTRPPRPLSFAARATGRRPRDACPLTSPTLPPRLLSRSVTPSSAAKHRASDVNRTVGRPPPPSRPRLPRYLRPRRRRATHVPAGGFHRHRFAPQRCFRGFHLNSRSYATYKKNYFSRRNRPTITHITVVRLKSPPILDDLTRQNRFRKRHSAAPVSSPGDA